MITFDTTYYGYPINTNLSKEQGCDTDILDMHEEPAEDLDLWRLQRAQALWIEERILTALGRNISNNLTR